MDQPFDVEAWLGPASATAEQREQITDAAARIDARYPDPDLYDVREMALNAAAQVILGDDTLEDIAAEYLTQRRILAERHAELTGALIATGGTETSLAERAGVTRVTVRKALGKDVGRHNLTADNARAIRAAKDARRKPYPKS
jgi:hypothetical protein